MAGGGLLILLALLYWGGGTQQGAAFWASIAVTGALLLACGALVWWLLLSPLPAGTRVDARPDPLLRQTVAYVVAAGGLVFLIGALWDEAWRHLYGTVAQSDAFWWQPHLLIHGSVGVIVVAALGAALAAARGPGGQRARWRADTLLGLLGLLSLFPFLVMVAEIVWVQVDMTGAVAASTSHIMMSTGVVAVMLAAVAVQASVLPQPAGWTIHRLGAGELNTIILLAVAAALMLLAGAGAWQHLPDSAVRPTWFYPAAILGAVLCAGQIGLHVLHRPGAAVLIFAAILFLRAISNFLFQQVFGLTGAGAAAEFLALIPAAAMDVVYVYRTDEADEMGTSWLAIGVGAAAMLAGGLLLMPRMAPYPPVDAGTLPGMVTAGLVVGIFGGWCGARLGRALAGVRRLSPPQGARTRLAVIGAGAYVVLLGAAFSFIRSAAPQ